MEQAKKLEYNKIDQLDNLDENHAYIDKGLKEDATLKNREFYSISKQVTLIQRGNRPRYL